MPAQLFAQPGQVGERVGSSVAISGAYLAAGAIGHAQIWPVFSPFAPVESGGVYMFERAENGAWQQAQFLPSPIPIFYNSMGWNVELEGDYLAVGSPVAESIYFYRRGSNGVWQIDTELSNIEGGFTDESQFGRWMDLSGDLLVAGDPNYPSTKPPDHSGRALLFRRNSDGQWIEESHLLPPTPQSGAAFGAAVAVHGDRVFVGASGDDHPSVDVGGVYVFQRTADGAWELEVTLAPPDATPNQGFGAALAAWGDRLVVGARSAAYVFHRDAQAGWVLEQNLQPRTELGPLDGFGGRLAISSDAVLASTPFTDDGGLVYVFRLNDQGVWEEQDRLAPVVPIVGSDFGSALAMDGEHIAVGDPFCRLPGSDDPHGAVFVFTQAVPADVNGDGAVNVDDLLAVVIAWGPCASSSVCAADVNGDGQVNVDDLLAVIMAWAS